MSTVLQLYNTESRQKEPLVPLIPGKVTLYTCGPTVYAYVHIGNWRTFIFEDLLRRTLEFFGFEVMHVMNLTDVDDKTIRGATAAGITLEAYTTPFTAAFFSELKLLNILPAYQYPAATEFIPQMIEMIQTLLDKGVAYRGGDGSVYYAIRKFPRYGCLSHLHMDELQSGASERVAADEYDKDHASDFVLWKHYDADRDGTIFWESPFGPGRPGWHLECSTMAMQILGPSIDIHVGGIDNMFPHHENEIAQSEACSGQRFAKIWMHSEHLVVDGKKMAKSLHNFYTLRDLTAQGFTPTEVRYMLMHTHYKTQLNFTAAGLEAVRSTLQRLNDFISRLQHIGKDVAGEARAVGGAAVERCVVSAQTLFAEALADDLNISAALAALFDLVRQVNVLCDEGAVGLKEAGAILAVLRKFDTVLGVMSFESDETVPMALEQLLQQRLDARSQRNWAEADRLRDAIHLAGYIIEDTSGGPRLKKAR